MAGTPIPLTTDGSGPDGAIPVTISGPVGGDTTPVAWADITGKPTSFPPATHNQAATTVTVAAIPDLTGTNVQLALADLAARVKVLETTP